MHTHTDQDHLKEKNYIKKFLTLTENIISKKESERFLKIVQNLKKLNQVNYKVKYRNKRSKLKEFKKGIF